MIDSDGSAGSVQCPTAFRIWSDSLRGVPGNQERRIRVKWPEHSAKATNNFMGKQRLEK
jgi:hypothetical protein